MQGETKNYLERKTAKAKKKSMDEYKIDAFVPVLRRRFPQSWEPVRPCDWISNSGT
jgi:hypothetical protein